MYFQYGIPLALTIIGVAFMAAMVGLQKLLAPNNPFARKLMPYECGEPPTGNAWINFNVRFYLIALVFVIFEVEVAFIYPIATVYLDWVRHGQRLFALSEILIFLLILFVGLIYVWVKRDLEWVKKVPEQQSSGGFDHALAEYDSRLCAYDEDRRTDQLDAEIQPLVHAVRARMLRDRADAYRGPALRYRALRRDAAGLGAPIRPDDHRGHADAQDGAADPSALRPDARSQVRHLDGKLLELRRTVPARLFGLRWGRQDSAGGCLRARMPAASRSADRGIAQAAGKDHERALARPGSRGRRDTRPEMEAAERYTSASRSALPTKCWRFPIAKPDSVRGGRARGDRRGRLVPA